MDNLKILAVIFAFFSIGLFSSCFRAEESSSAESIVVHISNYGAVPDDGKDDTHAVKAAIENNTFHRIPMETILMKCPDQRWALQNHVEKLKVINNVFYECEDVLIRSNPQVEELAENAGLYGTLDVRDNLIIRIEGKSHFIDARGFTEVNIGSNRFETGQ